MAEPIEDKNALTHRIEEDRVRMAAQASEIKKTMIFRPVLKHR
jgi:hypothetical protein